MMFDLQTIEKLSKEDLSKAINLLIENDFSSLVNALYRIDINEKKLKRILAENPNANAGNIIADLIIERQQQKQQSRNSFKQQANIPEEEKW